MSEDFHQQMYGQCDNLNRTMSEQRLKLIEELRAKHEQDL